MGLQAFPFVAVRLCYAWPRGHAGEWGMSETRTFDSVGPAENAFESSARALAEFVIRAAILPITLLLTKPSALARAAASGQYRPLPSPFLLALIVGIVISGVTSNLDKVGGLFQRPEAVVTEPVATDPGAAADPGAPASETGAETGAPAVTSPQAPPDFLKAVTEFYLHMDGVKAILFALPTIFGLWIAAGLISFFMLRGVRSAEILFAAFSLALAAIVEIIIVMVATSLILTSESAAVLAFILIAFGVFVLIVASKLIRLLFVIRKESGSMLIGAWVASLVSLAFVVVIGCVGAGITGGVFLYRSFIEDETRARQAERSRSEALAALRTAQDMRLAGDMPSAMAQYEYAMQLDPNLTIAYQLRGQTYVDQRDYRRAIDDYSRAIEIAPQDAALLNSRCWARALWNQELDQALADCNQSLEYHPDNADTVDSRALVHFRRGEFQQALDDYDRAVNLSMAANSQDGSNGQPTVSSLYMRGVTQIRLGRDAEGRRDIEAAIAMNPQIVGRFEGYGITQSGEPPPRRSNYPPIRSLNAAPSRAAPTP